MRSFEFTARNIGHEHYLTYVMGEGSELDEDALDYCESGEIAELVKTIYEEDDDYDYLTYDISGLTTVAKFLEGEVKEERVMKALRNVALGLISCKEQAVHLSYLILNKKFMYIDPDTLQIQFICLPVESQSALMTEFKGFARQLLANLMYDVDEDLNYVGQLLTYINSDAFNLRGLIGLTEAVMGDAGIEYDAEEALQSEDGDEIVEAAEEEATEKKGIMDDLGDADDELPEIGDDDDEDDIELEDAQPINIPAMDFDMEEAPKSTTDNLKQTTAELKQEDVPADDDEEEEPEEDTSDEEYEEEEELEELPDEDDEEESGLKIKTEDEESMDEIKAKLQKLVNGDSVDSDKPKMQKPIKINRAAIIQKAEEKAESEMVTEISEGSKNKAEKNETVVEDMSSVDGTEAPAEAESADRPIASSEILPKGATAINNTFLGNTGTLKINPYLTRVNTSEKIMITKAVFKIGKANRGVDYHVSGNGAISRQHAVIQHKGDSYYIKDNKSTNHTYVDDVMVEGDSEVILSDKCIIRLGDEDFVFKLR